MSHLSFLPRGEDLHIEVDHVVVGSGAGGATAAATLARGGERVALVEAGPWRDPTDYPCSVHGAMRDLFDGGGVNFAIGRALWPIVQGTGIGGTTVINSAICVRTPWDVFEEWWSDHGVGGRALADAIWRIQDQLEQELGAEVVPTEVLGRSSALAKAGADVLGYDSELLTRYVRGCEGSAQCMQGCRAQVKQSTNVTYVPEVLRRGGAVLSCAPVHRVLLRRRRAIGVKGRFRHPLTRERGARFVVRARRSVVVAASATHSPALLQRSGVRSSALGHGFRTHPGVAVFGLYDEPVDMGRGATQGWATTAFRRSDRIKLESMALPLEMVASRLSGGGRRLMDRLREYRHLAMWGAAVRARAVGRVHAGPGGPVVTYGLGRADMEGLRSGVHKLALTHFAAGAREVLPGIQGMPYSIGPDQADSILAASTDPRDYVGILSHLFGGCVMGRQASRSVCDGRGRVHGHPGLVVADASVFPDNTGINPQHTIMALARHFAELLLDDPPQAPRHRRWWRAR